MRRGRGGTCLYSTLYLCASAACSQATPSGQSDALTKGCTLGQPLAGAKYDIAKSKFAIGSKPAREDANGLTRWVGSHGVVGISAEGAVFASLNGGAPEASLPTWSADEHELTAHATDYFAGFGVEPCQIKDSVLFETVGCTTSNPSDASPPQDCSELGSSSVVLSRGVDGIAIPDSEASVTFVSGDVTTQESMYWPSIPADVVRDALAFSKRLNDPTELAEYKRLLPDNAQGDGEVLIHHSSQFDPTFRAVAVYAISLTPPPNPGPFTFYQVRDFDPQGARVEGWEADAL
jgi:hypothetical protein